MPPQTNALLSRVEGPGVGEAFDGPPAAGVEKWAGGEAVYLRERRDRQRTAEAGAIVIDRLLLVDQDVAIDWAVGDVVTFTRTGGDVETGTVQNIERPTIDDPDIAGELRTARLTLDPA